MYFNCSAFLFSRICSAYSFANGFLALLTNLRAQTTAEHDATKSKSMLENRLRKADKKFFGPQPTINSRVCEQTATRSPLTHFG